MINCWHKPAPPPAFPWFVGFLHPTTIRQYEDLDSPVPLAPSWGSGYPSSVMEVEHDPLVLEEPVFYFYDEEGYFSSKLPMISLQQRVRRLRASQFSRWTRLWVKLWTLWTFTVSSQSWSTILCGSATAAMGLTMFDLYFHPTGW